MPKRKKNEDVVLYRIVIAIANGSCEAETILVKKILKTFGIDVCVWLASCSKSRRCVVRMKEGLELKCDLRIEDVSFGCDLIFVPDGTEAAMKQLKEHAALQALLVKQRESGRLLAASGRAPVMVLQHLLPEGSTCYPFNVLRKKIPCATDNDVVLADNVVTSQGLGTAMALALHLGECLFGKHNADTVARIFVTDRTGTLGTRYLCHEYQHEPPNDPINIHTLAQLQHKAANDSHTDNSGNDSNHQDQAALDQAALEVTTAAAQVSNTDNDDNPTVTIPLSMLHSLLNPDCTIKDKFKLATQLDQTYPGRDIRATHLMNYPDLPPQQQQQQRQPQQPTPEGKRSSRKRRNVDRLHPYQT